MNLEVILFIVAYFLLIVHYIQMGRVATKLDTIVSTNVVVFSLLQDIRRKEVEQMALLDAIKDKVEAQKTVVDSVVVLLVELKAKLDAAIANGLDPVEVQALADAIGTQTQVLADAVVAGTPVAPVVPAV